MEKQNTINQIEQINKKRKKSKLIGDILGMPLPENIKTTGLAIVVHHGETNGNLGTKATEGKSNEEPLNEKGYKEISQISQLLSQKIPNKDKGKIRIYVNDNVTRNKETAEIIKKTLGIGYEQMIFSEDLRTQDKVYDENHKLIRQEYFSAKDKDGYSESIPKLRSIAADFVAKITKNNPDKINIFITNRVSYKGFENRADKDLNAIHDYNIPTGAIRIIPINSDGKPLNYIDNTLPISDQENQIKSELNALASALNREEINNFSENYFDKENRLRLKFIDFCKIGIQKGYINIISNIFKKYPNLGNKILPILLTENQNGKGNIILNEIIKNIIKEIKIEDTNNNYIPLLTILYDNKNINWKVLFNKIFEINQTILLNIEILQNKDVNEYFNLLGAIKENNKQYQKNLAQSFLGEVERDKFYIPTKLIDKNNKYILPNNLIEKIIKSGENAYFIKGQAGSGKTILSQHLAKELSKKCNIRTDSIDLNQIENISKESMNSKIPNNFEGKHIILIDGIDEKNRDKVNKLYNTIKNNKDKNTIYICSGRYLDYNYEETFKSYSIIQIEEQEENEIIQKYSENLNEKEKQEFTSKVKEIINKIGDSEHTPLIITMIMSMVEEYVKNDEYYDIFDKDKILLSEIYDTFITFLHSRERNKKLENNSRTKTENKFMSKKRDNLRIEFLEYLALFNGGYGDQLGFYPEGEFKTNKEGDRSYTKGQLWNIFYHRIDYKEYIGENISYKSITKEDINEDYEIIYKFIDSLTNYGLLACDEKKGFYFPHKSFQEYFGYKNLEKQESGGEENILSTCGKDTETKVNKLIKINNNEGIENSYIEQCKQILSSYSFNNKYKLFEILGKIKNERKDNTEGNWYLFESGLFVEAIFKIFEETFRNKEITYNEIKMIKSTFKPNIIENFKDLLIEHCHMDCHIDNYGKEKQIASTIIDKLNNLGKYGNESFTTDLIKLNIRTSGLSGEYPDCIFTDSMTRGPGYLFACIYFDREIA